MASFFSFILAHQGDAADPELLHWIQERLGQFFGSGPWVVVAIMGAAILSIPVLIVVFYLMQAGRRSADEPPEQSDLNQDGQDHELVG